jgi:V8-like Glu-specific endopeptidase
LIKKKGIEGIIKTVNQYGLNGAHRFLKIREPQAVLEHQLSTFKGQSGAPILVTLPVSKANVVIGIHRGSAGNVQKKNLGRLLTP